MRTSDFDLIGHTIKSYRDLVKRASATVSGHIIADHERVEILLDHIDDQKAEIERLRAQVAMAGTVAPPLVINRYPAPPLVIAEDDEP